MLAETFAQEYNVGNLSFDAVINETDIDGVVLAVPAPLHAAMAIAAMNAGKHVFVEKPLAMNSGEAADMIVTAKANGVELMVGHLYNTTPAL